MITIYQEILDAIRKDNPGFDGKLPNEDTQTYLRRILVAITTVVPDSIWNTLSDEAQAWVSDSTNIINEDKPCPDCPGYEDTPVQEQDNAQETATESVEEAPAKEDKAKDAKVKEPAAPKAAPEKKEEKAADPRRGFMRRARQLCILHPESKVKDIKDLLASEKDAWKGLPDTTISTCYYEVMQVLSAAKDLGYSLQKTDETK